MYVATLTLSNGVTTEVTRTWLMQAQPEPSSAPGASL